jgi:hypothetical protein
MTFKSQTRYVGGFVRRAGAIAAVAGFLAGDGRGWAQPSPVVVVRAAGFSLGGEKSAGEGANQLTLALAAAAPEARPFCQSAIKQTPSAFGPQADLPYFTVRFALPIPPENLTNNFAALTGLNPQVYTHNHSPGFELLPNGDALAIYFSTPPGKSENDPETSFVQARLRYGAEEWDPPELFFKTEHYNDQSGLLWNDGGKIRFFGGGRELSDLVPFKLATSTDNGANWTLSLPQLAGAARNFTAQPITSAFRGPGQTIYFTMDGEKATSFLWRSRDEGIHWEQMDGRTGGRHSAIVPLDDQGKLLSLGGKNASIDGWSPENTSTNWGATWSPAVASPFPPLGSAQRPSLIKLADGHLFFVSDSYLHKLNRPPPDGWQTGNGCFVALSTNQGATWHIKPLPVQLPNHERGTNGTLGYVTARQAANGVIHVLATETQPCLHYELNEAWILSDAGDVAPESLGGVVKSFVESYPNGQARSQWSARICPHGRYLLEGEETDFYENGLRQHQVLYRNGRKTGEETFWSPSGQRLWTWRHDLNANRATWTQYSPNGRPRLQSAWNTQPEARDLKRRFYGLVADGLAQQWDAAGTLVSSAQFANGQILPEGGR